MNAVKKSFMIVAALTIFVNNYAQNNSDFKLLTDLFPARNYPFVLSYDNNSSPFDRPLPEIPQKLWAKYITQTGYFKVKKHEEICFSGYLAKGKFPANPLFQLLLVAKDNEVSGCGEENHLITYSKTGDIVDTLFVFGRSTYYGEKYKFISFHQNAIISKDSIVLKRTEIIEEGVKEGNRYKDIIRIIDAIYHISEEGKFIKNSETQRNDVRHHL